MSRLRLAFLTFLASHLVNTEAVCPHQRPGLKRWSDPNTWQSSSMPVAGDSVYITDPILLDTSPPDLYNITIETTGSLIADPESEVVLRAANIYVSGSLEIGHEQCLFLGKLTITLTGTRESHTGEKEQKVILIQDGGTLEIHGQSKLSWTKISQTITPPSEDDIYYDHMQSENKDERSWVKGLAAYTFSLNSAGVPRVKQFGVYDLVAHGNDLASHIGNVDEGDILMISTQRYIRQDATLPSSQQWAVYDALETLLYGEVTNKGMLRHIPDDEGTTYGVIYQKGVADSLVETKQPLGKGLSISYVLNEQIVFTAETGSGTNFYYHLDNFIVRKMDAAFPIVNVIDDVKTWVPGDRIALASTDFEWRQTEERTVIKCDTCSPNQFRVDAPFDYTHFGKVIKGGSVDMRAEVALLSRNVVIEGEMEDTCPPGNENCAEPYVYGKDTFGAHVKVLRGYRSVHIEGVELRNVGQHTDLGRYPIHFHMCLDPPDTGNLPYIKEVSIHHTFARCITIHASHKVQIIDNVCFDFMGHGYFLEDGGERDTVFDGNLALGARRGTQFLEPTDNIPSGFWITNPNSKFVNNVAAGGDGTGIWLVFPDEPMGPSKDLGLMDLYEAKRTPIIEFSNNVAHSNGKNGIMFGNRLRADRTLTCCNHWQPKADPKDPDSEDIDMPMTRLTAYKNRLMNVWAEGGFINVSHVSVADSANGIMVENDQLVDKYAGSLSKSVIIGDSENVGVPEEDGDPRSLPMYWDRKAPHSGVTLWFGPIKYSDLWFDGFDYNSLYDTGAISLKRLSPYLFTITTSFKNILYAFDDGVEQGNLAITGTNGVNPGWEEDDGQKVTGFTWYRDTPTGIQRYSVVRPDHLSAAASDCRVRTNWRLAVCETKYGNIRVTLRDNEKNKGITFVRDDLPAAQLTFEMSQSNGPQVVLDGSHTYTMHFLGEIPGQVYISGDGMEIGDTLRVGICLPRDADFVMSSFHPFRLYNAGYFTRVDSLSELDAESPDLDGRKYYYDEVTGMLYYKFINNKDRDENAYTACADGLCPQLRLFINSGTLTDADCRDRLYGETPNLPLPIQAKFDEVLPANGGENPPEGWGAGITRPFTNRDVVDGKFGEWSSWSTCSKTCGDGVETRIRKCDSPRPANGGADCVGERQETRSCLLSHCAVVGDFSQWTAWGTCKRSDSACFTARTRDCTSPRPEHGGLYCTGAVQEVQPCDDC